MPVSLDQLDLLLLTVVQPRTIRRDGIRFQSLRYIDSTLAVYIGERVIVRYDPRDMAEIRVYYRDCYARENVGLVLIGMPVLEKRLARYPQLSSRVGFAHAFRTLSGEERRFILEHHWSAFGLTLAQQDFTDDEAMAAMVRITGGNFRLIHRLFGQIGRILQLNALRTITKEVVEAARECLVIGTT